MEKIYALAGKARSGKDSASLIIKNYYKGKKVLVYSCTMYLKKIIQKISDWNGDEETKPRDMLQKIGKEIKDVYPDYFIERMEEDIRFLSNYCDIIIITGVRLVKELEFLKSHGAFLIKVCKDADNNLTLEQKKDITEIDVDNYNDYDYVLNNNEGLEELEKKLIKILE